MNTVKSFWVGWASLCIAGGSSYYFAKKSINEDRKNRFEAARQRKQMQESLEYSNVHADTTAKESSEKNGGPLHAQLSPSQEVIDPAPTRHAPNTEGQRVAEKSKYEASEPYRAKKGDRLS
ncbi:hypothetical protein BP5796_00897 [Coleophoma crateriformis]|uniref:Uncharacterized protein n=1 Tax=Coleophoma crateriformis TaxID=565419 RepID=A0A3D8T9D9_9HELO|nr:hypothetical protein BP5796_00897 [Coleophoma crateriformis]